MCDDMHTLSRSASSERSLSVASTSGSSHAMDPNLPKNVTVLHGEDCVVYVLGTAHVSTSSCVDVVNLIQAVRPQIVMVELCNERRSFLSMEKRNVPTLADILKEIRQGQSNLFQVAYGYCLSRISESMDVLPGEEFKVALQEAEKIGAKILLGDRRVSVTLGRVWGALSWVEKVKLVFSLVSMGVNSHNPEEMTKMIEDMKETDIMTEAILELSAEFPSLLSPLIDERDLYMSSILKAVAARASCIVAVVGAGHLAGIRRYWELPVDMDELSRISTLPPKRPAVRWGRYTILFTCSALVTTILLRRSRVW